MGECNIPRREFLYELQWWEIRLIIDGNARKHRNMWSAIRWQTYYLMSAQVGSEGMRKSSIHHTTDLIKFPWDDDFEDTPEITEDEIAQLQRDMAERNAQILQTS